MKPTYLNGTTRRSFVGAGFATAITPLAWATLSEAPAWPAAQPALRYRYPARQSILAATLAGKRVVAVGMRGVILWSDNLVDYKQAAVPVSADLTALCFVDETCGWAVGNDGVILVTRDGGKNWVLQRQAFGTDERLFSVLFSSRLDGVAVGAFGLCLQTRDGGASWLNAEVAKHGDSTPHLYQLLPGRNGSTVVVGEFGSIFVSSVSGIWNSIASPVKNSLFSGALCGGQLVAVGLQGAVVASRDGGASWTAAQVEGAPNLIWVLSNPTHQPVLLDGRGGMLRSCDAGHSYGARTPSGLASPTCAVWPVGQAEPQLFSFDGVGARVTVADDKKTGIQISCIS